MATTAEPLRTEQPKDDVSNWRIFGRRFAGAFSSGVVSGAARFAMLGVALTSIYAAIALVSGGVVLSGAVSILLGGAAAGAVVGAVSMAIISAVNGGIEGTRDIFRYRRETRELEQEKAQAIEQGKAHAKAQEAETPLKVVYDPAKDPLAKNVKKPHRQPDIQDVEPIDEAPALKVVHDPRKEAKNTRTQGDKAPVTLHFDADGNQIIDPPPGEGGAAKKPPAWTESVAPATPLQLQETNPVEVSQPPATAPVERPASLDELPPATPKPKAKEGEARGVSPHILQSASQSSAPANAALPAAADHAEQPATPWVATVGRTPADASKSNVERLAESRQLAATTRGVAG